MNCKLSQGSRDMLSQLLADETEPTRLWLRNEMDRTVDPMLHSIFQRLTNKLANTDWDREGTDGYRSRIEQLNHVETNNPQLNPSLITQPSTSLISSTNHDSHQQHSIGYEPELDPEILAQVKREIKEEQSEMALKVAMDNNATQTNQQIEVYDQPKIKEELDDEQMMEIEEEKFDDCETNNDGEIEEESEYENHHENLVGADDDTEIDSDNDDEIEVNQNEGKSSRSVENAQMGTTLPHQVGQSQENIKKSSRISKRKQTEEEHTNELNNQEETKNDDDEEVISPPVKRPRPSHPKTSITTKQTQFVIGTLQCPQCGRMFAKDKLNKHLKEQHSICPFRCLVKNCKQSFNNKNLQGHHIAQSHQSATQWPCDKCDKHFPSYALLSRHNNQLHLIGHFKCSYPSCTFTGEYRRKMFDHYTYQHKQTFKCQHSGCPFETAKSSNLNQHRRVHLGIRPYRCKWPNCVFAAALQSDTIRHIRRHLAQKSSSVPNVPSVSDPMDFLEVIQNL